jgi:hypothetical protein
MDEENWLLKGTKDSFANILAIIESLSPRIWIFLFSHKDPFG